MDPEWNELIEKYMRQGMSGEQAREAADAERHELFLRRAAEVKGKIKKGPKKKPRGAKKALNKVLREKGIKIEKKRSGKPKDSPAKKKKRKRQTARASRWRNRR